MKQSLKSPQNVPDFLQRSGLLESSNTEADQMDQLTAGVTINNEGLLCQRVGGLFDGGFYSGSRFP